MTKRLRIGLFLFAALALILLAVGGIAMSRIEQGKAGRCYRDGSTPTPEELRARMMRNLLLAEMEASARENGDRFRYRTFLIRKSMSPDDVIQAVATRSITTLPEEAAYPINTEREVQNVDSGFLLGEFSIVRYWPVSDAEIIPGKSIRAVGADDAKRFFDGGEDDGITLSLYEKALGYGSHLYEVDVYWGIDLGCCEKRYFTHPKHGHPPEWYVQRNIDHIVKGESPSGRHLVVSNCGDILHRSGDDYVRFFF